MMKVPLGTEQAEDEAEGSVQEQPWLYPKTSSPGFDTWSCYITSLPKKCQCYSRVLRVGLPSAGKQVARTLFPSKSDCSIAKMAQESLLPLTRTETDGFPGRQGSLHRGSAPADAATGFAALYLVPAL